MSRYFHNKQIELLAPAGTFDIFQSIIRANCDAVYFGGQILNMRMIRKGYNLSNDEISQAIRIAHDLGKKVYITVNNLFNGEDLESASDYLGFLNAVQPDGLIVQDLAVLQLVRDLDINLPLHASVMMNVHNLAMIQALQKAGISRVVLSREMSLEQIKYLKTQTDMEMEYFTHGDMCIAHGAQCHYSGMLFGMSSNRGRCLKPCRWDYHIKKNGKLYKTSFPMAVKDMCMYTHLPEMIEAGVDSFKIEGRMRQKDFIVQLINYYGNAIDRYIEDPTGFDRYQDYDKIVGSRKRDLSTGYAFGKPGLSNINRRYEGTGKFYSTGKVFSFPTEEISIDTNQLMKLRDTITSYISSHQGTSVNKKLSVRAKNLAQAKLAIEKGVDTIYLTGDVYKPHKPFTKADICYLLEHKGHSKIILGMPKMMGDADIINYKAFVQELGEDLDGLLITNIGALSAFSRMGIPLIGDYTLNIYNHKATEYYKALGLDRFTLSIETQLHDMLETVTHSPLPSELIVHGRPPVMYLEHDLYANTVEASDNGLDDIHYIEETGLHLVTPAGEYPIYKDQYQRCHMLSAKELCLHDLLPSMQQLNITHYRIEGMSYTLDQLGYLIDIYHRLLQEAPVPSIDTFSGGHTLGALSHS